MGLEKEPECFVDSISQQILERRRPPHPFPSLKRKGRDNVRSSRYRASLQPEG